MEDLNGKNIPDAPLEGSERIELTDDAGHVVGIADVGVGHPDDPYRGQLLSVDDERRIDEKGELVVRGVPWSSPQDLYGAQTCVSSSGPSGTLSPVGKVPSLGHVWSFHTIWDATTLNTNM